MNNKVNYIVSKFLTNNKISDEIIFKDNLNEIKVQVNTIILAILLSVGTPYAQALEADITSLSLEKKVSVYNDLLFQCDFNGDGIINTKTNGKKVKKYIVKREYRCKLRYDGEQLDKQGVQLDKIGEQLDKIGEQLDKQNTQLKEKIRQGRKRVKQGKKNIDQLKQELIKKLLK